MRRADTAATSGGRVTTSIRQPRADSMILSENHHEALAESGRSPVSGEIVPCQWKTPFEMLAEQKPETIAAPTPVMESVAVKIAKPAIAELPRPPDDPGLEDDLALRNRTLATDG
jgi:hypothetical protein